MAENQTECSRMSSNFWWLSRANQMKFTPECLMCMEEQVLVKKIGYKWAKYGFATISLS